ncbi:MAG: AAA family ATPase [Bryobacteraceae bacterium]
MRIESFRIDGFGLFRDVALDVPAGLTVFFGGNESGKSTLLAFFRFALFGFPRGRKANRHQPLRGGDHGGRLVLSGYTIDRRGSSATLVAPDGSHRDGDGIRVLCGNISREVFENIYAFSLEELQRLDEALEAGDLRTTLFGAGAGIKPETIRSASKALIGRAEEIFPPKKKVGINACAARLAELRKAADVLGRDYDQFDEICRQIEVTDQAVAAARERRILLRKLDALRRERQGKERELQLLEFEVEDMARSRTLLNVKPALLARAADVRSAERRVGQHVKYRDEIPEMETQIQRNRSERESLLGKLGAQWNDHRLESFDTSLGAAADLAGWIARINAAEHAVRKAGAREEAARAELDRLLSGRDEHLNSIGDLASRRNQRDAAQLEFERALHDLIPGWGEAHIDAFDTSPAHRVRLQGFRTRLAEAEAALRTASGKVETARNDLAACKPVDGGGLKANEIAALRERTRLLSRRKASPYWIFLAVAAAVLSLAGYPYPAGAVLAMAAIALWLFFRRRAQLRRDFSVLRERLGLQGTVNEEWFVRAEAYLDRESDALHERQAAREERAKTELKVARHLAEEEEAGRARDLEIAAWRAHLESFRLPGDFSPDSAIDAVSEVENCRRLRENRDSLSRNIAALEALEAVRQSRDRLLTEWRVWLKTLDIPEALAPELAREFFDAARQALRLLSEERTAANRLDRARKDCVEFDAAVKELLEAGERPSAGDPVADVNALGEGLRRALELDRQLQDRDLLMKRLRRVVEEAGSQEIQLSAGMSLSEDLEQDQEELDARIRKDDERLGELRQQKTQLETDARLAENRQQQEATLEEMRRLARRWAVLTIARRMLDDARKFHEQQRQPAVVRQASTYFQRLTEARYKSIRLPLEDGEIQVETSDGGLKNVEALSRGTAEQLYLALRFGYIEEFARRSMLLPIVMDDILVNFDAGRTQSAAQALAEFSKTHQVLFFTCHPWIVETFRTADPTVAVVDVDDGSLRRRPDSSSAAAM